MSVELDSEKAVMRRAARAARAASHDPAAAIGIIENFPAALGRLDPVAGYWPVGDEIDPRPLMAALAKAGRRVALPRMLSRAGPAKFLVWEGGAALSPDAFGVLSPPEDAPELTPKLLLMPLLAFDRSGARLGQGGGHYDRILALLRAEGVVAVGLAYAAQEHHRVPIGDHDQRMDWIVTEREAIRCGPMEGLRGR